ncbi:DUF4240 domain-containing protein [Streptomyces sp. JNUCC 64]
MDINEFWDVVGTARSAVTGDTSFADALVDELATRSPDEILGYQERFEELHGAVYRWDVWAAAYLIGGGCSDDGFIDFRAGLIGLGREWYEKAAASPDSLAGHPAVIDAARTGLDEPVFDEDANYGALGAFRRLTGEGDAFYDAWDEYRASRSASGASRSSGSSESSSGSSGAGGHDMGEDFDFDDPDEMARRLPRLSVLYAEDDAR